VAFDDPWPRDPRLDPFRDAVWELRRHGAVEAYLLCQVFRMRSFPFAWVKREWLWYQVNWLDGTRDRSEEDYGPAWYVVAELEHGRLTYGFDDDLAFVATRVTGPERDRLWDRFGPPT
jgi:hypothetical protein